MSLLRKYWYVVQIGICLLILIGMVGDAVGYLKAIGIVSGVFAVMVAAAVGLPYLGVGSEKEWWDND